MPGSYIENIPRFGFFGKLPINGDFIQRDLPVHFTHHLDGWLQENLLACQEELKKNWLKHYLTSPIWRFFIAPSVIDENAYIGILGPSVDSVGRYFPMTIATPISAKHVPSLFTVAFQAIYSGLESVFLKYLNADSSTGSISVETLSEELLKHSTNLNELITTQKIDRLPDSLDSHRFILSDQADISGAVSSLWLMQIMQQHTGTSLWWSNGSHAFEPSLLVNRGLPSKQQFISMLSGFNGNNWRQNQLSISLPTQAPPELTPTDSLESDNLGQNTQAGITQSASIQQHASDTKNDIANRHYANYAELPENDIDSSSNHLLDDFLNDTSDNSGQYSASSNASSAGSPTRLNDANTVPLFLEQTNTGFSELGHKRSENQDAILIHKSQSMWVVADGMGGHSEGDKASQAIVEHLSRLSLDGDLHANVTQVKTILKQVNRQILDFAKARQTTCGSTVVILLRNNNQCAYLWAGDSRLYLSRNGRLHQLTQDHSVDNGLPQKNNAITRAVGVYEQLDIECGFINLLADDRFLLCSDGVYDSITESQLDQALKMESPLEASNYLKKLILTGTAKDNLSGALIWF